MCYKNNLFGCMCQKPDEMRALLEMHIGEGVDASKVQTFLSVYPDLKCYTRGDLIIRIWYNYQKLNSDVIRQLVQQGIAWTHNTKSQLVIDNKGSLTRWVPEFEKSKNNYKHLKLKQNASTNSTQLPDHCP